MKNYVQKGDTLRLTVTDDTGAYDVAAGEGFLVGTLFGVALSDTDIGEEGEFAIAGVFDLAKTTGQAWTVGVAIYWDDATQKCTTSSSGNTLIGNATEAAASNATTGRVRLNG